MTDVNEKTSISNDRQEAKKPREGFLEWLDNLKIAQKGTIVVAVPLITGLVSVVVLLWLLNQSELQLAREERSAQIHSTASMLGQVWVDIAISGGTFCYTQDITYKNRYLRSTKRSQELLAQLAELVGDQPKELQTLQQFRSIEIPVAKLIASMLAENPTGDRLRDFTRGRITRMKMQELAEEFRHANTEFLTRVAEIEGRDFSRPEDARDRVRVFVIAFGILTLVISVYLAVFYSRSITRRLKIVMNNSMSLAARSPLHSRLRGHEEIAQLDQIFHKMARALEEATRQERAITENAADVICSVDGALKFKEVNPACLTAWGYDQNELIGKSVLDLVAEDDRQRTESEFNNAISSQLDTTIENKISKKDKSISFTRWSLHWSNEGATFYCTVHDATEQHEIERLKMEFVTMVSHDLRTPLSSLQGALTMLDSGAYGNLNEKGKSTIVRSHDDLSRLLNLIDSLLDIEKMEAGKMHMEMSGLDLLSVVSRSVNSVGNFAQRNGVTIQIPNQSQLAYGDESRLVQVIVNLLSNAIKFTGNGGRISISYRIIDNCAEVRVADNGRGIPSSRIAAIFDRYEQVDAKDDSEKGGRGLGLAICKSIVEGHFGTIGVESEEGKGSTFWFRIPQHQVEQEQQNAESGKDKEAGV